MRSDGPVVLRWSCSVEMVLGPLQLLQDLEMERIADLQAFVRSAAEIERSVMPILTACYNGMVKAADDMDAAKVSGGRRLGRDNRGVYNCQLCFF